MNQALLILILCASAAIASRRETGSNNGGCTRRVTFPPINPFKLIKVCNKQTRADLKMTQGSTKCILRDTLVELVAPDDDYKYNPSFANVKRCQGSCSLHMSCMAMQTKSKDIAVHRNQQSNFMSRPPCGYVQVEEHLSCGCKLTMDHCNSKQEYSAQSCSCVCNASTRKERLACRANEATVWDASTCQCLCRESIPCPAGLSWNESTCKCDKITMAMMAIND